MAIEKIIINNFKSYKKETAIDLGELNMFMGANSSGKSTALQALLILKQTLECNSPDIDLLFSGKYVTVGDYKEAVNDPDKGVIQLGIGFGKSESSDEDDHVLWTFKQSPEREDEVLLSGVEITSPTADYNLIRSYTKDNLFCVYINGKKTQYYQEIVNLYPRSLYIGYDSILNEMFYDFLKELLTIVFGNIRTYEHIIQKDKFLPTSGLLNFERELILSRRITYDDKDCEETEVEKVIRSFCQEIAPDSFPDMRFPLNIRRMAWQSIIKDNDKKEEINSLSAKYLTKLEEYRNCVSSSDNINRFEELKPYLILSDQSDVNDQYADIVDTMNIYRENVVAVKDGITYLGPIREKPQGLYNVGFESIPKYVGPTGAFFASVLFHENKERKFLQPYGIEEDMLLSDATEEWLGYLGVAKEAKASKQGSFGIRVTVKNMDRREADIMNVGIGTSQILPVILTGLLSKKGEILMFEQPELHLHPYSQSRLADFFAELAKKGRKIIVETHSEQMLLRLRYLLLVDAIPADKIAVYFFQNKDGTKVEKVEINGIGEIHYPDDFKDTTEELMADILKESFAKRRLK